MKAPTMILDKSNHATNLSCGKFPLKKKKSVKPRTSISD